MKIDPRAAALYDLMLLPDLPCLPRRGHKRVLEGDTARAPEITRRLELAYLEHKKQDHLDVSRIIAFRSFRIIQPKRA